MFQRAAESGRDARKMSEIVGGEGREFKLVIRKDCEAGNGMGWRDIGRLVGFVGE